MGNIGLATKRLRILSIPCNGKIRNHLVANPILQIPPRFNEMVEKGGIETTSNVQITEYRVYFRHDEDLLVRKKGA